MSNRYSAPLLAAAIAAGLLLAGCAGGGEGGALSCPYPDEVSCESLSSVYERTASVEVRLPPVPEPESEFGSGWPAVRAPRVLRVWLAPWQDADGDLHGAQEIYMLLEGARWRDPLSPPGFRIESADAGQ